MSRLGVVRADTYNKLGSMKGWALDWKKADPIIKAIKHPDSYELPSKLFEWTVSDVMKAINAQQEAAKTEVIKRIYRKFNDSETRKELVAALKSSEFLRHPWLHRQVRNVYKRGHTYFKNQIVYQNQGYTCKRINRHQVKLEVQGLEKGKRITLTVKSNRLITGQIRLIEKEEQLEIHAFVAVRENQEQNIEKGRIIGVDKGYTEAFFSSEGEMYGKDLGKKLTTKTERINTKSKNKQKLYALRRKNTTKNPLKASIIKANNLGKKTQNRKLNRDKAEIKGLIRSGIRDMLTTPTLVYCEDLSVHFSTKKQAKSVNRKLNSWVKGELQDSLESIALQTGSTVKVVNPAYTSQVDSVTGTLLGCRDRDSFIRFTGDVLQADTNAAINIKYRGTDTEIHRYMKSEKVLAVLLHRTVCFLASFGVSVQEALDREWLHSKFGNKALEIEATLAPSGVEGTSRKKRERTTKVRYPEYKQLS